MIWKTKTIETHKFRLEYERKSRDEAGEGSRTQVVEEPSLNPVEKEVSLGPTWGGGCKAWLPANAVGAPVLLLQRHGLGHRHREQEGLVRGRPWRTSVQSCQPQLRAVGKGAGTTSQRAER